MAVLSVAVSKIPTMSDERDSTKRVPDEIALGHPLWPARGAGFQAYMEAARERGEPILELLPTAPAGYSTTFAAEVDAPRAPMQPGWYQDDRYDVPLYIWVHALDELIDDFPDEADFYNQGIVCYQAHSVCTNEQGELGHAAAAVVASWTPILAPDPSVVAADRYAPATPVYRTPDVGPLPPSVPHRIGVIDVDYARVGSQRLPEKWDIDVVGVLIVERENAPSQRWGQVAFRSFTAETVGELASVANEVDLIVGHNLLDGDYRCLRTYADELDLAPLVAKTVDTLYAARKIISGGERRPAGLDLTSMTINHGLRERAKKQSRTDAHRGIKTVHDAEDHWFFQPISDDCELVLEVWLNFLASRKIQVSSNVEHPISEDDLRWFLHPPFTLDTYTAQLIQRGTIYQLPGAAREESAARIHRAINDGTFVSDHRGTAATRQCIALLPKGGRCPALIYDSQPYCRDHRRTRLCRGNPALGEQCTDTVAGDHSHCDWHRRTALYVAHGTGLVEDFRAILDLPGWENMSIWGFDTGLMSFFAQLHRNNTSPDAPPTIWLSGMNPTYSDVVKLRDAIAIAARCTADEASRALWKISSHQT